MKYFPQENLIFKSKLNKQEVLQKLNENVEQLQPFKFSFKSKKITKPYEGFLYKDYTFDIKRVIQYQNSFLLDNFGNIIEINGVVYINVKMKINILVRIFFFFFLFLFGFGTLLFIYNSVIALKIENFGLIFPGTFLFLYLLVMFGFKYESNIAKKDFKELFEAKIENEQIGWCDYRIINLRKWYIENTFH